MPNLSRRHLVTTAAALPALALPALADPIGPNHPDSELLRLGVELEAVIVDWHAQRAIDRERSASRQAAWEGAGLPDIDCDSVTHDEWIAYRAHNLYDDNLAEDGSSIVWNGIDDRQSPLIDAIMEQRAQTIAGFGVQVRAISLSHSELWDSTIGHNVHHRPFIEAACAVTGVVPVPLDAGAVPQPDDPFGALSLADCEA